MNINSIKFTRDNTEGFNQEIFDKMNDELESQLADLDSESSDYQELAQQIQECIFNKYC